MTSLGQMGHGPGQHFGSSRLGGHAIFEALKNLSQKVSISPLLTYLYIENLYDK